MIKSIFVLFRFSFLNYFCSNFLFKSAPCNLALYELLQQIHELEWVTKSQDPNNKNQKKSKTKIPKSNLPFGILILVLIWFLLFGYCDFFSAKMPACEQIRRE